jgi:heme-degrading monooxygenase HmoA
MEKGKQIVARVWQGRVPEATADEYAEYLFENGIKKIQGVDGNIGVQVLRRTERGETEFITISYWESREVIRNYAGDNIELPHHLPKDADYLIELPTQVLHYDVEYNLIRNTGQSEHGYINHLDAVGKGA